ncbi:MAG TPA: hypothetical protein VFQ60_05040 [Patescibacteria group bacterium]|nr:hypothetical protein [Patescibacteria group bacterium]
MENFEKKRKEKPAVLYLAAQTPGIRELLPKKGNYRDKNEGAVIFSTPDKALASAFLVKGHGDHWMQIGYYRGIPVVVINADREEFIAKDTGGVIYSVPSDTFDYDPDKGLREKEWTSREPVKPLAETRYPSALDTMIEHGVQVYFVDKQIFDEIKNSKNHGFSILKNLHSENERRGKNISSWKKSK